MGIFLSKLLPVFLYPLGAFIALATIALVLSGTRYAVLARSTLALALVGLWAAATPYVANNLIAHLEGQYPPRSLSEFPKADAVILLGGIMGQLLPPRVEPDVGEAADRILLALELFHAGMAPWILIAGGNLPWLPVSAPESELIANLLVDLGVPRSSLILETESRNTRENATNSAKIFIANGWKSGLLVTSAIHMPRALASFKKANLDVTPASADVRVGYPVYNSVLDLLPDADALARTTSAIKEFIGGAVYRMRDWA